MNKKKIAIIIASIVGIVVLLGVIFFAVNFNRVEKKEDHANDKVQININEVEPKFTNVSLEDLPEKYSAEQAAKDGCFVIANGNKLYNKDRLDEFVLNTKQDAKNRIEDKIRIVYYTVEGDAIITDVEYKILDETYIDEDGKTQNRSTYVVTKDNTRDEFAAQEDRKRTKDDDLPGTFYTIIPSEYEDHITVYIALTALINYVDANEKVYKDIEICSYTSEAIVEQTYPLFYGKVIDSSNSYIMVEPNEGEEMRNYTDKISVGLPDNNDMIYEIGTNVKVTYTGIVRESYPPQIDAVNIETKSAENFDLIFMPNTELKTKEILKAGEMDRYNYNIYSYSGDVSINIDGKTMVLREALIQNKITMEGIIEKANKDYKDGKINKNSYSDGGSVEFKYSNYTILKYNTLNGNRDMYIGIPGLKIN